MYFEPTKKTYYRFPSAKSVTKLVDRMYFPEKPSHAKDKTIYQYSTKNYIQEKEQYYDL
ncbi:MAG: hypothetical protein GX321_00970 [Clostridiales bacterium]|nr:hypothetical protein [Clostridiales bacterium]